MTFVAIHRWGRNDSHEIVIYAGRSETTAMKCAKKMIKLQIDSVNRIPEKLLPQTRNDEIGYCIIQKWRYSKLKDIVVISEDNVNDVSPK